MRKMFVSSVVGLAVLLSASAVYAAVSSGSASLKAGASREDEGGRAQFQEDRGVGTVVTEEDREQDEFDEEDFLGRMQDEVERQEDARELFDLDGGGTVSARESARVRQAVEDGELTDKDEANIRRVYESGASEAEKERIRDLFRDQGDEEDGGTDNGNTSPFIRDLLGTESVTRGHTDDAERERLRSLFTDQDSSSAGEEEPGDETPARVSARADCPRGNRAFFNLIPSDLLFCGDGIPVYPGDGCPRSACIIRFGESEGYDSFLGAE